MNKQDISNQTKVPGNGIDSILEAMGIPKDLPEYTDDHLTLIQTVRDIHKKEGLKSWAEAVGIYRKPEREAQLNEIVVRSAIAPERIGEILDAMKLKLETLTEPQIQLFQSVCQMLQSGTELGAASQAVVDQAKAAAKAKITPKAPSDSAPAQTGAIAVATPMMPAPNGQVTDTAALTMAESAELAAQREQAAKNLHPKVRDVLNRILDEQAQELVHTMPNMTAQEIEQYRMRLWNQLILAVDHILGERVAYHMNTPEFAKTMETRLSGLLRGA